MLGIRMITKISWFLGSRMDLARVGGRNRWMEVPVEVEVGEGFRGWDRQEGGFPRWIHMGPEGTLAVRVDQAVTTTLSLGLEVWVRAAGAEAGTLVGAEADVMEDMVEVGVGMEVPGGMTIVIVIAITLRGVTTVEGEVPIIEVVGAVTGHAGEEEEVVGEVVVAVAVVGDTELSLTYAFFDSILVRFRTSHIQCRGSKRGGCNWYENYVTQLG